MVHFQDAEDIDQLKKFISKHVYEKTGRKYPPVLISVKSGDENSLKEENNSIENLVMDFEKENEATLEHIDDFDSDKFFGAIYEWPDIDCCSIYGASLIIFVKRFFRRE